MTPAPARLRLGVVGAGNWGRNHVRTAAGLAAAIPAVAGYNYFVARLKHLDEEMDDFAADLIHRLEGPAR